MDSKQQKAIEISAKRTELANEVNTDWTPINEDKPLMNRLREQYEEQRYSWFVIDGQGNTMFEGLDELTAREYSMKDSDYSIGWDREHVRNITEHYDERCKQLNENGDEIIYENKDILSKEDINEM